MSLSSLNLPPLVATLGSSAFVALPILEKLVENGTLTWDAVRAMNAAAYALNVYATSRPGRIDGEEQENFRKAKGGGGSSSEEDSAMKDFTPESGKTLVAPAGWAFAIWGPIFIGEAVFVATQFLVPETAAVASIIKKASAPFSVAQAFQCLWAASFRPKYKGRLMFISSAMLGGIAYSLSRAHEAFAVGKAREDYSLGQYCLYFLPMALHFGWTSAATLVNLNGAHAQQESISAKTIAVIGHLSAIAATAAGVWVTVSRKAPVYGGVISWALFAVADGMKKRLRAAKKEDDDRPGVYGAKEEKTLCTLGAWMCAGASACTAYYCLTA